MKETRACKKCGEIKPLDHFYQRTDRASRVTYCRKCQADHQRMYKYNMTPEEYQKLLIDQDFRCAICSKEFKDTRRDSPRVDHCHESLANRGLLCHLCNVAIGQLGDNIVNLTAAAAYVAKWDQRNGLY